MSTSGLRKEAVDSIAADYWKSYYDESGYGALWVRNIPMRVRAELEKRIAKKAGKAPSQMRIEPLVTVVGEKGVTLEGRAIEGAKIRAFVVDFDHSGNVVSFDAVDVK